MNTLGPRHLVIVFGIAVAVYLAAALHGARDIARFLRDIAASTPPAAAPRRLPAGADPSRPLEVAIESLGRRSARPIAFDPAVANRVVGCDGVSVDGGRTWSALETDVRRRPMLLGGAKAAPPVVGPDGRILCGDAILAGPDGATGLGDIETAVEWSGTAFGSVGLPTVAGDSLGHPSIVAYLADGGIAATRGPRLVTPRETLELPGTIDGLALDAAGGATAILRAEGKRARLAQAPGLAGPWTFVTAPGPPRAIAAVGDRVYVAGDMLGRREARGEWAWTPWPPNIVPTGLAASRDLVVAWGRLSQSYAQRGGVAISRDGGVTMRFAITTDVPVWVAVDPHHVGELLLLMGADGGGELVRMRLP